MLHNGTQQLFDYWNELRGSNCAPLRVEIAPAAISSILPSTFILESNETNQLVFRLAGTTLCLLFGGEMKGTAFTELLDVDDRNLLIRTLRAVEAENVGVLMQMDAISIGQKPVTLEALFLPLRDTETRILGALHALDMPYWAGAEHITNVTISSIRILDAEVELISLHNRPAIMMGGRTRALKQVPASSRFAVLQGGAMLGGGQAHPTKREQSGPNLKLLPGGRD